MTVEIEVLRAEPHTLDQAIATAHKQANLNVKLGLKTFKGCKLPNPSQNTTSKNLVNLVNLNIATVNTQREPKRPNPQNVQNPPHNDKGN
jgi:hypothetical protein